MDEIPADVTITFAVFCPEVEKVAEQVDNVDPVQSPVQAYVYVPFPPVGLHINVTEAPVTDGFGVA